MVRWSAWRLCGCLLETNGGHGLEANFLFPFQTFFLQELATSAEMRAAVLLNLMAVRAAGRASDEEVGLQRTCGVRQLVC